MEICNHENCGKEKNVWLPLGQNSTSESILHPWCKHCGLVKNLSEDHPQSFGYWINILSRIESQLKIKKVQKRLIANELTSNDSFNDLYGITGSAQKELFSKIVNKYCKINLNFINSLDY